MAARSRPERTWIDRGLGLSRVATRKTGFNQLGADHHRTKQQIPPPPPPAIYQRGELLFERVLRDALALNILLDGSQFILLHGLVLLAAASCWALGFGLGFSIRINHSVLPPATSNAAVSI